MMRPAASVITQPTGISPSRAASCARQSASRMVCSLSAVLITVPLLTFLPEDAQIKKESSSGLILWRRKRIRTDKESTRERRVDVLRQNQKADQARAAVMMDI